MPTQIQLKTVKTVESEPESAGPGSDKPELVDPLEMELATGVDRRPRKQRVKDVKVALVRGLPHHPGLFEQVLAERGANHLAALELDLEELPEPWRGKGPPGIRADFAKTNQHATSTAPQQRMRVARCARARVVAAAAVVESGGIC